MSDTLNKMVDEMEEWSLSIEQHVGEGCGDNFMKDVKAFAEQVEKEVKSAYWKATLEADEYYIENAEEEYQSPLKGLFDNEVETEG